MIEHRESIAVAGLLRLTQDGKLNWREEAPPESLREAIGLGLLQKCYRATYEDRNLALFLNPFEDRDSLRSSGISLFVIDDSGLVTYAFPRVSTLRDLYRAVESSVGKVDDFLERLVNVATADSI